ncbi:hypothetical protein [Streptosporangium sp. LJ11]|uniref:hypothetical protein n=1 Tax=Streptosporangium sp. LJ11 TaxID=3436927 RepID=UPI003F79DED2
MRDLPADCQALLTTVRTADGPVICKAICERLGPPVEPGQVEGVRAELNRLAERGWLRKTPGGAFAAAPTKPGAARCRPALPRC